MPGMGDIVTLGELRTGRVVVSGEAERTFGAGANDRVMTVRVWGVRS